MVKVEFLISEDDAGQRLDKYLKKVLTTAPQSLIARLLRKNDIRVNNKKTIGSYLLEKGDMIFVYLSEEQKAEFIQDYSFVKVTPTFKVIVEDDNILIVNKPSGLIVHPSSAEKEYTLTNMVLTYLFAKNEFDPSKRGYIPSPVSRIDQATSGIVVFAKKQSVHQQLATAFTKQNDVSRVYRALVYGIVKKDEGTVSLSLIKKDGLVITNEHGKAALTKFSVLQRVANITYVEATIFTGKQHQIRVSFAEMGHPILGDAKYGKGNDGHSLMLNAYSLTFHALEGPLVYLNGQTFIADNTAQFKKILGEQHAKH